MHAPTPTLQTPIQPLRQNRAAVSHARSLAMTLGADGRHASARRTSRHGRYQQDAYRCHASRGDSGRGTARRPRRGIRLRIRRAQAVARKYLLGQGDARRAVAAGRIRRLWRQPPRLPRLQRNPSRLLSDPGRGSSGSARRGGRSRSCRGSRSRSARRGTGTPRGRTCRRQGRA